MNKQEKISAGEAVAFEEWFKETKMVPPGAIPKTDARMGWQARDPEVTALKQELAQAKEEIERKHSAYKLLEIVLERERDQAREERWVLEDKLYNSVVDLAALEGKLVEMRQALTLATQDKWKEWIHEKDCAYFELEDIEDCECDGGYITSMVVEALSDTCGQGWASPELVREMEGKLGEMRKVLEKIQSYHKSIESQMFEHCQPDKGDLFSAFDSMGFIARAALEPIKKEEKL